MAADWLTVSPPLLIAGGVLTWQAMGVFSLNVLLTVRRHGPGG